MNRSTYTSNIIRRMALLALLALTLMGGDAQALAGVQRMVFPVTLSDGQTYSVVGYLHYEDSPANKPLQVLLHGATYTHKYWDLPAVGQQNYSYTQYMLKQGYTLLALDLLGAGESSRPDGDLLELRALADSVHQVTTQLRSGQNTLATSWTTIVAVGHSLGSAVAIYAQASWSDFNALVTTGMGHEPHTMPGPADLFVRATSTPYFTLLPAERTDLFYHPQFSHQSVVDYDAATFTEPISRGVFNTVMARGFDPTVTLVGNVSGSVLVQLGDKDKLYPSSYANNEAGWWTQATVTVQSIPATGHAFNMHHGRHASWVMMEAWLRATIGSAAPTGTNAAP